MSDVKNQAFLRAELLLEVALNPKKFSGNGPMRTALRSQGKLAKFEDVDKGIKPVALNTLKAHADSWKSDGWAELDARRIHAHEKLIDLPTELGPKHGTKDDYRSKFEKSDQTVFDLLEDLLIVSHLYELSLRNARNYAKDSGRPELVARCEKNEKVLREIASRLRRRTSEEIYLEIASRLDIEIADDVIRGVAQKLHLKNHAHS